MRISRPAEVFDDLLKSLMDLRQTFGDILKRVAEQKLGASESRVIRVLTLAVFRVEHYKAL